MPALYLHVPVHRFPPPIDASTLTTALVREIEQHCPPPSTDRDHRTLYLGGRPVRLLPSALRTLADTIRGHLGTAVLQEVTAERSPTDASSPNLDRLRDLGVTRLSIEGRSFADEELRATGAPHSAADLGRVLRRVRESGFQSTSVDLSFGGAQSHATWKRSLQRAVDLRVPHLTLHEREHTGGPDEERARADRFAFAMRFLDAKGYEQYELTHFARPGHRSCYQTHVYAHGNVLGIGPGAESFWWPDRSDPSTARRWSNVTDVAAYVDRLQNGEPPVVHQKDLDPTALAREYILLRLRTIAGLDLDVLEERYGVSLRDRRAATLDRLAAEGLIHDAPDRVRLTPRGRLLADAITQRLIRES
ncbi:MAG: coproporphyrinogen-III oxidase family protein [Salinibacter sp.]